MSIEVKTVLDQVECLPGGRVQFRLTKQISRDGVVSSSQYHRGGFNTDEDVDNHIKDVNSHLETMGFPPIEEVDAEKIRALCSINRELSGLQTKEEVNERFQTVSVRSIKG